MAMSFEADLQEDYERQAARNVRAAAERAAAVAVEWAVSREDFLRACCAAFDERAEHRATVEAAKAEGDRG
jgi:hypothetical protein